MTTLHRHSILVVDDDEMVRDFISDVLEDQHYAVTVASKVHEAKTLSSQKEFDLCITDIQMDDGSGFEIAHDFNLHHPQTPILLMTAYIDDEKIRRAETYNIASFLTKPFTDDQIRTSVSLCLRRKKEDRPVAPPSRDNLGLIGSSPYMVGLRRHIRQIARSDLPILVLGPSGSGKELIVRAIHRCSDRNVHQIHVVNCAAIPAHLEEAELFGSVKGAFTGADRNRPGIICSADQSTLFLDEIGDLSLATQSKLLRAIEYGEIQRIGEPLPKKVNVRYIAATNKDLEKMVEAKTFRHDLYYRLKGFVVSTRNLREHAEDIPDLIAFFIGKFRKGENPNAITREALHYLANQPWKGNVRELAYVIHLLCHHCRTSPRITPSALELIFNEPVSKKEAWIDSYKDAKNRVVKNFEQRFFIRLLQKYQGNISHASREANINRSNFIKKLKMLDIDPDHYRRSPSLETSDG